MGGWGRALGLWTPLSDRHHFWTWRQPVEQRLWAGSEAVEETAGLHYLGSSLDRDAVWYENVFSPHTFVLPTACCFIKDWAVGFWHKIKRQTAVVKYSQMIGLNSNIGHSCSLFYSKHLWKLKSVNFKQSPPFACFLYPSLSNFLEQFHYFYYERLDLKFMLMFLSVSQSRTAPNTYRISWVTLCC